MKFRDLFRLSLKNLTHRFSQSALLFVLVVLLGVALLSMGAFCYGISSSVEKSALKNVNTLGITVTKSGANGGNAAMEPTALDSFIAGMKENKVYVTYTASPTVTPVDGGGNYFPSKSFIPDPVCKPKEFDSSQAVPWTADNGQNDLWLSQDQAARYGLSVGNGLRLTVGGKTDDYTVRGILPGDYSYLHYRALPLKSLTFNNPSPAYSAGEFDRLTRFVKSQKLTASVVGELLNARINELLPVGLGLILVLAVVGLSLSCIVNTLRMNLESNAKSIGTFKALGMRKRDIYWYVMLQTVLIVILGTLAATLIALPIVLLTMPAPVAAMMSMLNFPLTVQHSGFAWFLPFAALALLLIAVFGASAPMFRNYFRKNANTILQEADK